MDPVHDQSLIRNEGPVANDTTSNLQEPGSRQPGRLGTRARKSQVDRDAIMQKAMELPCPLSQLSMDPSPIPVRDMEAWVRRPVEARHQEARKRRGRVPRPANTFILYRSAYTARAKHWLAHGHHKAISVLLGRSWKMEPAEVREKYERLAKVEKQKHTEAHPHYRFRMTKKRNRSSTTQDRSQKSAASSKSFLNYDQDAQPSACSAAVKSEPAGEYSTGPLSAEQGAFIKESPSRADGMGPLHDAASAWSQGPSDLQIASAEHDLGGSQPGWPGSAGEPGLFDYASFLAQLAASGLEARNRAS